MELEKKFVSLVKESDDAELARLIVEAGLIDARVEGLDGSKHTLEVTARR